MAASIQKQALVLNGIFARAAAARSPIDLFEQLNRFATETFAEIGFGVELGALSAAEDHPFQSAFDGAQRLLMQRFTVPAAVWKALRYLNADSEKLLKQYIHVIDDTVYSIIDKALANRRVGQSQSSGRRSTTQQQQQRDIVSLFLDNVSYDGSDATSDSNSSSDEFDPVFLRDVVVNFLIAGRDTTAQALSWFFYMLSEHPHIEVNIRAELAAKLPQLLAGAIATPSMEHASELVYLEAALRETLRLHPSVPLNSRVATRDVVLSDGTLIRKGDKVSVAPYVIARMAHVWGADAKQFKPERWLDVASCKIAHVSVFKFPSFNAGPRACPGQHLAMMMKITAATVLSKFHLALVPGQRVTYELSLTHPIKGELLMHVEPVETSAATVALATATAA